MSIRGQKTCNEFRHCKTDIEKILYLFFSERLSVSKIAKSLKMDKKIVKKRFINHCRGFENGTCLGLRYLNSTEEATLTEFVLKRFDANDSMSVQDIIDEVSLIYAFSSFSSNDYLF